MRRRDAHKQLARTSLKSRYTCGNDVYFTVCQVVLDLSCIFTLCYSFEKPLKFTKLDSKLGRKKLYYTVQIKKTTVEDWQKICPLSLTNVYSHWISLSILSLSPRVSSFEQQHFALSSWVWKYILVETSVQDVPFKDTFAILDFFFNLKAGTYTDHGHAFFVSTPLL